MRVDHLRARHSEVTSFGRRSGMTQASTLNNTLSNDEETGDMPFAIAGSVKHTHKKSLMIAANNMLSPQSTKQVNKFSFRK
jgi:hypothetical protein